MSNYYMLGGDGKEYGPISAEQLRHWAAEGRANAQTQVRVSESGPWTTYGAVPELTASATTFVASAVHPSLAHLASSIRGQTGSHVAVEDSNKRLALMISSASGWMKLLAVLMFISAAVGTIFTFGLGLVVTWIPLWLGVLLFGAANRANAARASGSEQDLMECLDKLRFYFKLTGVLMIICLIAMAAVALFSAAITSYLPSGSFPGLH
jgi:hypothetical protein